MRCFVAILPFLTLLLVFVGCKSSKTEDKHPSLEFQIDPALLEPKIQDKELGIEISPPAGWEKSDSTFSNSGTLKELRAIEMLVGNPKHFFQHNQTNSLCILSKFATNSVKNTENLILKAKSGLEKQFPSAKISTATFLKDKILVYQIMLLSPEYVILKLVCELDKLKAFEVVYILPKNAYTDQLRAIESSIGSILGL